MPPDAFVAWQLGQDGMHALVDRVPIQHIVTMAGAGARREQLAIDIIATLQQQLRGTGCRPTTDDIGLPEIGAWLARADIQDAVVFDPGRAIT